MSVEYYTHRPFEEMKSLLLVNLGSEFVLDTEFTPRWLPKFEVFAIRDRQGQMLFCIKECREHSKMALSGRKFGGVPRFPDKGTLTLELFESVLPKERSFLPWVERVLDLKLLNEYGEPWLLT